MCVCGYQDEQGRRASPTARGYDYAWQQDRKAFLLANPWCIDCLPEYVPATVKHHILPKPQGGDEWSNSMALCKAHHDARTNAGANWRSVG